MSEQVKMTTMEAAEWARKNVYPGPDAWPETHGAKQNAAMKALLQFYDEVFEEESRPACVCPKCGLEHYPDPEEVD